MPRPKTQSDETVLATALALMTERGPEALTFASLAERCGLSGATLVQRFGSKAELKRSALLHAWDRLDEETARLAEAVPRTPDGAIEMLVGLSAQYGEIEGYADTLRLLREDLRDPVLRSRGVAWMETLRRALGACFADTPDLPESAGLILATQWQGSLLWWSFNPSRRIELHVRESLRGFISFVRESRTRAAPPER